MGREGPFDVHVVSHTHWDREWYLPHGRLRQRLVGLMDELLDLPPDAPPFLLDGQTILLEDYLAVRPEREPDLRRRLASGQLEAGPWYVLADELIPSAEALVRNLLAGRRTLARLGASAPPVLYSPDAFGHPAALPSLAAGFGASLIVLWRGLGGPAWPDGDTFRWQAPDGSCAVVHHLPPDGYEYGANLPAEERALRERWGQLRTSLARRARLEVLLLLNGADHHARQARLSEAMTTLARIAAPDRVHASSLGDFARAVMSRVDRETLPPIVGELRASYGYAWGVPGTLSTRAHQKRRNAQIERLLTRECEPFAALSWHRSGRDLGPLIRAAWSALLACHPHDTLCGCSADEVARAMDVRLEDAEIQARGVLADALHAAVGHDPVAARDARESWRTLVVIRNAAPRARGGVAELEVLRFVRDVPVGPGSGFRDSPVLAPLAAFSLDGGRVPYQLLERELVHDRVESPRHYPDNDLVERARVVAWVGPVPPYGVSALTVDDGTGGGEAAFSPVAVTPRSLDNGILRLKVTEEHIQLEAPALGLTMPSLVAFDDIGDVGDLYTHSPVGPPARHASLRAVRLSHHGPLRGALETTWGLEIPKSSVRQGRAEIVVPHEVQITVVLDAGSPFLRLRIAAENRARDHRLRVRIVTGIANGIVLADAAFGPIERRPAIQPAETRSHELASPTAPLARYVTCSNAASGVTVISDGLAEYEVTSEGEIAITLVRAVGALSRDDLPERPGHAGWPVDTPQAQCLGPFAAELAILPHGAVGPRTLDSIERTADNVLHPLRGESIRAALHVPDPTAGVELEGLGVALTACKISEDGEWLVLRCVNVTKEAVRARWRLGGVREARSSRLDETPMERLEIASDAVEVALGPRGVSTILVR